MDKINVNVQPVSFTPFTGDTGKEDRIDQVYV